MSKTCNGCKTQNEEMSIVTMSGANWEKHEERHSREKKRLWVVIIVLIAALIATNISWIIYESQYETTIEKVVIDAEQDGDGVNIVGGGDITYGSESKNN